MDVRRLLLRRLGNIYAIGTPAAPGTQGYRTYVYDSVGRLTSAQVGGVPGAATYGYGYDAYGNRNQYGVNQQWSSVPASPATNKLSDASYDPAGNQTSRGSTAAPYDGFNMATSYRFDTENVETLFIYTANDERIGALRGSTWSWSLRDDSGKVLRQYQSSSTNPSQTWAWVEDFVYRDGLLLGSERPSAQGGRRHYHLDHLGSPRLVTDVNGTILSEHDFLPFGEERTPIVQQVALGYDREEPLRFTGHERDFDTAPPSNTSSYVDYMHARYYAAVTGRFLSPDPVLGNLMSPQSWNRYACVLNNPVNLTDPTGMQAAGESITVERDSEDTEARKLAQRMLLDLYLMARRADQELAMRQSDANRASVQGVMAFVDGVIPFGDPLENTFDLYGDDMVEGLEYSQMAGVPTQWVATSVVGGQIIRIGQLGKTTALFRQYRGIANNNGLLRVGWGYQTIRKGGYEVSAWLSGLRNH